MTASPPPSYASESLPDTDRKKHSSSHRHSKVVQHGEPEKQDAEARRPRHKDLSPEEIKAIARKQVRHSAFGPDFLKDVAKGGLTGGEDGGNFKVLTGSEAASMYQSYLGYVVLCPSVPIMSDCTLSEQAALDQDHSKASPLRPIVLAFTVQDAGRKAVEFYMTWRGKTASDCCVSVPRISYLAPPTES